jgi:hypothetical protein
MHLVYALYSLHNILFIVFYALCFMHCILCIVFYALCSMQCILCIVLYVFHFMHCIIYNIHSVLCIVFYAFILCIVLYSLYYMHGIQCIVLFIVFSTFYSMCAKLQILKCDLCLEKHEKKYFFATEVENFKHSGFKGENVFRCTFEDNK